MPKDRYRGKRPTKHESVADLRNTRKGSPEVQEEPSASGAAEQPISSGNSGVRRVQPQDSEVKKVAGTGDGSAYEETTKPDKPADGVGSFGQTGPSLGQSVKNAAGNAVSDAGDAARTGAQGLKNAFQKGASAVTKGTSRVVTTVVTKTANAIGVSKPVASVLLALVIGLSGGSIGVLVHSFNYEQMMMSQDGIIEDDDCKTDVSKINQAIADTTVDANSAQMENAKKLWAVFKALGATDEQAAGALGNFEQESQIDPTCIEGIYNEPYTLGPRTQNAIANIAGYTENVLFPKYHGGINKSFYRTSRYGAACGVGFFQATGCNYDGLVDSAQKSGKDKMSLDAQIIYMLTTYGKASWVKGWCGKSMSVADAAIQFLENFEGCSASAGYAMASTRVSNAQKWYNTFHGQTGDTAYAQSILAACNTAGTSALSGVAKSTEDKCGDSKKDAKQYNNGDLARAAVAYAWETTDMGRGNDGTQLYKNVHKIVLPGDGWYQSCDRGVATAVRWSDADDNFCAGPTDTQDSYCQQHPELFDNLGSWDKLFNEHGGAEGMRQFLQPGDIFLTTASRRGSHHGHIVMWVSNEIVKEKYPNSAAEIVSASYNERSPGCENYSPTQWYGHGYYVYRYKGDYSGGKYKNVAEGQNWSGTS